ncbi:acetyltransferase [Desulfuromonas soudanensis]|uniref:Acetyltransferase n=1 Tax=Desulfuromonas soudanensis TaxID=1603606 RepID=A0A0M4CU13_9BACT|nr:gamma carbonic anhydrase family protein [Desulfuromonas soudanensis]ALC14928.1 acetyltransferase [Desulfuromonas soudanensis]
MIYHLEDRRVTLIGTPFIAPNATLIGSVTIEKEASVWFNVVIRADNDLIRIGEGSNIQDGSVLHVDPGFPLSVGRLVTVGHRVILHGCTIGDGSLIGMNAVVLNGAWIGRGCLIGANALITEKMVVPDNSVVLGSPGRIVRSLDEAGRKKVLESAEHYREQGRRYREGLKETAEGGA